MLQSMASAVPEITDGGPIYTETLAGRFPVEPCNTMSNFIFLFIIIYWVLKTRMNIVKYPMVVIGTSILAVGFVGGTAYHATRSSEIWLVTDYMAIYFAIMTGCIYLWHRITGNWFLVLIYSLLPALTLRIVSVFFPVGEKHFIAASYSTQVIMILLPVLIHCWLNKFRHVWVLVLAFISFAVALSFRELDAISGKLIPSGTHFLWHIFGGISAFLVLHYIYITSEFFYKGQRKLVD
jgi:hypothetical protein